MLIYEFLVASSKGDTYIRPSVLVVWEEGVVWAMDRVGHRGPFWVRSVTCSNRRKNVFGFWSFEGNDRNRNQELFRPVIRSVISHKLFFFATFAPPMRKQKHAFLQCGSIGTSAHHHIITVLYALQGAQHTWKETALLLCRSA